MTRTTVVTWTLAAVLSTAASLALAQSSGGDSAGGNAGPKTPAAGASGPQMSHGKKDGTHSKARKDKATRDGSAASGPSGTTTNPDGTGGKSNPGGGPGGGAGAGAR